MVKYTCHSGYLSTVINENDLAPVTATTSGLVFFAIDKPLVLEHEVAFKLIRRLHA